MFTIKSIELGIQVQFVEIISSVRLPVIFSSSLESLKSKTISFIYQIKGSDCKPFYKIISLD
jgi:hypothetical protein